MSNVATFPVDFTLINPWTDAPIGLVVLGFILAWLAVRLFEAIVDVVKAARGPHADQLAEALRHSQVQSVQVEALRAQLVLLCDQARDHLAVLQGFREGYELFATDVSIDDAVARCDARHA